MKKQTNLFQISGLTRQEQPPLRAICAGMTRWAVCTAATLLLTLGVLVGPSETQAASRRTSLFVLSHPRSAPAQTRVEVPVRLVHGANRGNPGLGGKRLAVTGTLKAGFQTKPINLRDVATDGNGDAVIVFSMPGKLRNAAGRPVGTALMVEVRFQGESNLAPSYDNFSVVVD